MVSRIMPEAARSESLTPDSDFFEKLENRILGETSMPRKRMIGRGQTGQNPKANSPVRTPHIVI